MCFFLQWFWHYIALFGSINGATIQNLGVESGRVFGYVDGGALEGQYVTLSASFHKGETSVYTGAKPTKASVGSHHYSFKGLDKAMTNISSDLTVTVQFTATAHTAVIDKAVAATCTNAGKTESSRCSACNTVIVAQQTVPATGHSYVYTSINELQHSITCKNCNYSAADAAKRSANLL